MKPTIYAVVLLLIGIPGVRLLWASRGRSEATAERLLGIAFVVGSVAIPLRIFRMENHPSVLVSNVLRGAVFPWACFESQRYYAMMKKRASIGLAEPIATNRFALWTLWTGALSILPIGILAVRVVARTRGAGMHPEILVVVLPVLKLLIVAGFATAGVCLSLSFFPPAIYARWLTKQTPGRRAEAAA